MTARRVWALVVVVVLALAAVSLAGCGTKSEGAKGSSGGAAKEPVKIGAVLSLTGTYAGLGAPEKNTLEMEVARINEAGGINGRPVEIVIEDDATDAAKAQAAVAKLLEQDGVVAVLGATGTGQTMAMRADIDRAGVPQVSCAGGTVITQQLDKLVFATPWSNSTVVPFQLKYLKGMGVERIGVISDSGGFGKDGLEVLKAEAPKAGIEIVATQEFNPGDTDMTTQLTKIKGSGADAVVLWSAGKEAATVAKNMKDLGIELPLIGSHGNARVEFIEGAGEAAEGFLFAAGKVLVPETYGSESEEYRVATEFIQRYTDKYGKAPDTFAGHAYDALYLVVEAAKRVSGELTPAALRDEIEATSGFVGIGGTFTFSATDHNGLGEDDIVMYRIDNGKWALAE